MLNQVIDIARDAGKIILTYYKSQNRAEEKADGSPLTLADLAANECILGALKNLACDIPIISEESHLPDHDVRSQWTKFWLC